jgi:hypothetical protein
MCSPSSSSRCLREAPWEGFPCADCRGSLVLDSVAEQLGEIRLVSTEADTVQDGEAKGEAFPPESGTVGGIAGSEAVDLQEARPSRDSRSDPRNCSIPFDCSFQSSPATSENVTPTPMMQLFRAFTWTNSPDAVLAGPFTLTAHASGPSMASCDTSRG